MIFGKRPLLGKPMMTPKQIERLERAKDAARRKGYTEESDILWFALNLYDFAEKEELRAMLKTETKTA